MHLCECLLSWLLLVAAVYSQYLCPEKGEIYERGITIAEANLVVKLHNDYRMAVANGSLKTQPMAMDLKRMVYDSRLGRQARIVSSTCDFNHVFANDSRWPWVGQNMYITYSNKKRLGERDWARSVSRWFEEHKFFTYPNISTGDTSHYTQLIWANSSCLGCDFIHFESKTRTETPYAKMYTCNYGPGGNYAGRPPYRQQMNEEVNNCKNLYEHRSIYLYVFSLALAFKL